MLLDFAERGARQLVHEEECSRNLEQTSAARHRLSIVAASTGTLPRCRQSDFAAQPVRYTVTAASATSLLFEEKLLDFA
jgi:hypothetical protein